LFHAQSAISAFSTNTSTLSIRHRPKRGSTGSKALIYSLDEHPTRGAVTLEDSTLRHLIYGHRITYRVIYAIDEARRTVTVLHIRHSARDAFTTSDVGPQE